MTGVAQFDCENKGAKRECWRMLHCVEKFVIDRSEFSHNTCIGSAGNAKQKVFGPEETIKRLRVINRNANVDLVPGNTTIENTLLKASGNGNGRNAAARKQKSKDKERGQERGNQMQNETENSAALWKLFMTLKM